MRNCLKRFNNRNIFNYNKFKFSAEIKIKSDNKSMFCPTRGALDFKDGKFTIFEFKHEEKKTDAEGTYIRLPQVPYEIKEHALKGVLYTLFLTWGGRFLAALSDNFIFSLGTSFHFIPAAVFCYHYLSSINYMYNAVTGIKLNEDGKTVTFEFKLRKPLEVEIKRILKNREENFLMECYTEPFLFPLIIDYSDVYSAYSLKSKKTVYLYGDNHECIKNGELLRAVINGQPIKTK